MNRAGIHPDQASLFGRDRLRRATWEDFLAFHQVNPQVYEAIRREALARRASGQTCRIKRIVEDLRDAAELQTSGDAVKINNSFVAFYSRLLTEREPELRGAIRQRVSRADRRRP